MSWLGVEVSVTTILVLSLFPFNAFGSLECVLHIKLDSVDRSAGFPLGRVISCDKYDITNNLWYRFTGAAGSAMSTSCVPERHCGAHSPGWLKGPLPSKSQGVVNRRVCYHWQGDCCKFQNKIRVRNCGKFFVYRLVKPPHCNLRYCGNAGQGTPAPTRPQTKPPTTSLPVPIECQSYTALSDADRAPSYHVAQPIKCDKNDISKKWYRFTGAAGSAMPTNCVSKNHCGTHAPGWLDGSHPKKSHGIVTRKVCFSWNNNCCFWNNNIRIRNCGGFYVYELIRTPQCHLRYCGNGQAPTIKPAITTKNPGNYPNECRTYTVLSSRDRAQGEHRGNLTKCDKHDLTKRWYRFTGDAGTQIATSCVPDHHCGTHSPGWMRGSHPRQGDGVVTRRVCYNWIGNCCHWYNNIRVRNCGGFYVYELIKQNYCYLRYCGNGGPAPTTKPPVPTGGPDLCVITKPCQNGAVCISSPGGYTCLCKPGFTGTNCELDVDECSRNPCRNGATCINNFGGYRCKCTAEFQGKHCDIDVNECIKKPCQNGGTCSNKPGGYTCYCPIGILGKDCETDIDECQSQPCQNGGTCQNNVGGYKCFCHPGFNGQNCEKDIDECSLKNPCQNGATCVNSKGSYTCQCLPGFTGKHCDQDIDECSLKNPCQNGATCVNSKGSYTCQCLPGFTGKHCDQDIDECSLKNPCQNGATCVNSKGSYTCQCLPGFTGNHCDQDIDECSLKNPCQNGATCVNNDGGYNCRCLPGFTGKHCDQDIDECSLKNPCQNGATCVNNDGGYNCSCLPGFTGKHCELEPTTKPGPVQYNKVGCFFDKGKPNSRPFPTLLANLRPEIDWNDLVTTVINKCAKKALKNEYKYFGIQFYGECWSGPNSKVKYDIDGPSSNCPAGVGAGGSLMVYKIVS